MPTPFEPFKNATLTFLVDDPAAPDTVDSVGNPVPTRGEVVIEAFLKPYTASERARVSDVQGAAENSTYMKGFVTSNNGVMPKGINPGDRSVYAKYRDQEGQFTMTLSMQNQVGADKITGDCLIGIFDILGGQ